MNAEPFLHANLHEQLEPDYVIAQCKPHMFTFYSEEEDADYVCLVNDESNRYFEHMTICGALGYAFNYIEDTPKIKYRKMYDSTMQYHIENVGEGELTIIGENFQSNREKTFLLDKKGKMLGYIVNPNGDELVEKETDLIVNEFILDRFYTYQEKPKKIQVHSSITTRLEHTDVNVMKEMIHQSPFFKRGVTFTTPETELSLMVNDGWIIIKGEGDEHIEDVNQSWWYPLHVDELPDKLNEKSISRLFKKVKFSNKKGVEREMQFIEEKLGLTYDEKMSRHSSFFLRSLVRARTYAYAVENYEYMRSNMKEDLNLIIKLIAAYSDPELRGELRVVRVKGEPIMRRGKIVGYKAEKRWEWGTSRIRYIGPPSSKRGPLQTRFYTRSCLVSQPIKHLSNYPNHKHMRLSTPTKDGKTHVITKWRKGHWKGIGGNNEFPTYFAGRPPHVSSRPAIEWMEYIMKKEGIHIQHEQNGGEVHILETPYRVDGYCKETKTIYEFHGDVFHGNPRVFESTAHCHPYNKEITAGELCENTIQREQILRDMNYNLVVMWESEWEKQKFQERDV